MMISGSVIPKHSMYARYMPTLNPLIGTTPIAGSCLIGSPMAVPSKSCLSLVRESQNHMRSPGTRSRRSSLLLSPDGTEHPPLTPRRPLVQQSETAKALGRRAQRVEDHIVRNPFLKVRNATSSGCQELRSLRVLASSRPRSSRWPGGDEHQRRNPVTSWELSERRRC